MPDAPSLADVGDLEPEQYGTSMHWPCCINGRCTGCLPPLPALPEPAPELDLSIFRGGENTE